MHFMKYKNRYLFRNANVNWLGTCRGLAVIGVFLTHFLPHTEKVFNYNSPFIDAITINYIDVGKFGVAMLFLIAGYLAPSSKRRRSVKQFAVNRFFRLYPVYWLDIILVGVLFAFDGNDTITVLSNCTMLQMFFRKEDLVGLFWTLPIELMLYFGVVIFERYIWDYKKLRVVETISAVGTICLGIIRHRFWNTAPVAIGLLITIALVGQNYKLFSEKKITKAQLSEAVGIFVLCLTITSVLAYQADTGYRETWYRYVISYGMAILVFTLSMWKEIVIKPLTALAVIAYPVYLLQEIVHRVAFSLIWKPGMNALFFSLGTILSLIIVSIIVHLLIEKPFIQIGKKIEAKELYLAR